MYCDYCDCDDCKFGSKHMRHIKTIDNKWICDVCYYYELCVESGSDPCKGLCHEKKCEHRPKIVGDWEK